MAKDIESASATLVECRYILKYLYKCLEHTDDFEEAQDLTRKINNME